MSAGIQQAIEFYELARSTEEAGELGLAELYYLQSWSLFQQAGDAHILDAVVVLNALAFLSEKQGDYDAALKHSKRAIELIADPYHQMAISL